MAEKKRKKTGIGLAIWLIVAIIIIIVFLVKWETIHNNLIRAGILQGTIIEKEETPEVPKVEKKKESSKKKDSVTLKVQEQEDEKPAPVLKSETPKTETEKTQDKIVEAVTEKIVEKVVETAAEKVVEAVKEVKPSETSKPKVEPPKPAPATTTVKLYYVVIDANGSVNYKAVNRTVAKDSPLTNAINALLAGPTFDEKNCTTLIPKGTKLLGVSIKDGVATLNFSDAFEFNQDGIEGYLAQLKQIINTATEFSSVNSVQFLINGEKKEYLGSDGVWIGTPLARNSL
ncbi:MAG: GerMN domain-containing protein [Treponema sp.]|nr:GerMN domain-containing protein [Treponema sp.]